MMMKKTLKILGLSLFISGFFLVSALGLSSNAQVMLDGEVLSFDGLPLQNINGRIMVPFRPLLEHLGATVSFDTDTGVISAAYEDKTVSFQSKNTVITLTDSEGVRPVTIDAAPFIDENTGRTYVSARFLSTTLGFDVGWDGDNNTVIIINTPKLLAIDSDFSIVNQILTVQRLKQGTAYNIKDGHMTYEYTPADTTASPVIAYTMDISGRWKDSTMQMLMTLNLDYKKMYALYPTDEYNEIIQKFKDHGDINIEYRFDPDIQKVYYRNELLDINPFLLTTGTKIAGDSWIEYDLSDVNYSYVLGLEHFFYKKNIDTLTVSYLFSLLNDPASYTVSSYDDIRYNIALFQTLFSDKTFTVTENGDGTVQYTRSFDSDDLNDAITGLLSELGVTSPDGASLSVQKLYNTLGYDDIFSGNFSLVTSNDAVVSAGLSVDMNTAAVDETQNTRLSYECAYEQNGAVTYTLTTGTKTAQQAIWQTSKASFHQTNLSPDVSSQKKNGVYIWEKIFPLISH